MNASLERLGPTPGSSGQGQLWKGANGAGGTAPAQLRGVRLRRFCSLSNLYCVLGSFIGVLGAHLFPPLSP